jgi:hypothetical protein
MLPLPILTYIFLSRRRRNGSNVRIQRTRKSPKHIFFSLAFETMGPINYIGQEFILDLGHRISAVTDDPCESCFLFQRISVTLQHFNAVRFTYAFEQEHDVFDNQPGDT